MRALRSVSIAAVMAVTACGGGSGSGSSSGGPTTSPTPAPSPSPTSGPSAEAKANFARLNLAGATASTPVAMRMACSGANQVLSNGQLLDLGSRAPVSIHQPGSLRVQSETSIRLEGEGLSLEFFPLAMGAIYTKLYNPVDFDGGIVTNLSYTSPASTFGFVNFSPKLCFFAAGPAATANAAANVTYHGFADGMAQTGPLNSRLIFSKAKVVMGASGNAGTFELKLLGSQPPFDFGDTPATDLGTLQANITVVGDQIAEAGLSGLPGFTGSVKGQLAGPTAMILTFEVHNPAGEVVWGAVAVDSTLTSS